MLKLLLVKLNVHFSLNLFHKEHLNTTNQDLKSTTKIWESWQAHTVKETYINPDNSEIWLHNTSMQLVNCAKCWYVLHSTLCMHLDTSERCYLTWARPRGQQQEQWWQQLGHLLWTLSGHKPYKRVPIAALMQRRGTVSLQVHTVMTRRR